MTKTFSNLNQVERNRGETLENIVAYQEQVLKRLEDVRSDSGQPEKETKIRFTPNTSTTTISPGDKTSLVNLCVKFYL
jgi:hypothetical protein